MSGFKVIGIAIIGGFSRPDEFNVMLSEALQRNAKHEARLSNISESSLGQPSLGTEIESLT